MRAAPGQQQKPTQSELCLAIATRARPRARNIPFTLISVFAWLRASLSSAHLPAIEYGAENESLSNGIEAQTANLGGHARRR